MDLQIDTLLQEGVFQEHIYQEMDSGKKENHQGLEACLKAIREGNTLIVWKLDRLGRNLKYLVGIV